MNEKSFLPARGWSEHRGRFIADCICRGKAPATPVPKGERKAEYRKWKEQRYDRSSRVQA